MLLNFLVLTDFSPAGARAGAYAAALAAPLGAALHLVHVFSPPPMTPRLGEERRTTNALHRREAARLLHEAAQALPLPATTELVEADWAGALQRVLAHYHPALLLAGLAATDGPLDEWLSRHHTLPLAHQTG